MTNRDCIVVHSGVQHSAELSRALEEEERLLALCTRLQVGSGASWPWTNPIVRRVVLERRSTALPDDRIVRIGLGGLGAERLASRARWHGLSERISKRSEQHFARQLVNVLDERARCAVITDMQPLTMGSLREHTDLALLLDISHPLSVVSQALLRRDAADVGVDVRAYDDFRPEPVDQAAELEFADHIVVASEFSLMSLKTVGVARERVSVVPYSVKIPSLPARGPRKQRSPLRLLSVGAMSERKGMTLLLRTMNQLHSAGVDVHLDLVGREAGAYRLPERLPSNVRMLGSVPGHRVREAYGEADLLVLPSMCEGFGRTILEALAYGCGVITTEASGGPDVLSESPDAPIWVLPVDERDQLAEIIASIAYEPVQLLDPEAAIAAASKFDEHRYRAGIVSAVEKAIASRKSKMNV